MSTVTRTGLIAQCKEKGIRGYSGKTTEAIQALLAAGPAASKPAICRLNYIGSKFQLIDWLQSTILEKTGRACLAGSRIADLFAGTGVVSHHFRVLGAIVTSNDAELYSAIITHAFTRSVSTLGIDVLSGIQTDIDTGKHLASASDAVGNVTKHYSPYNGCERQFFTVENARRIDYIRGRIEDARPSLSDDDYRFLLASLLVSADAVSNVPAVYGCYLKSFKAKALKPLVLQPIHTIRTPPAPGSRATHSNVLDPAFLASIDADIVYLDPPYNERQYSKNYFPLNIIAKTPATELTLTGKTGIPTDCFISPFCKRGAVVEGAFETLFRDLKTTWIFLSYNSEAIVSKERMLELMGKYGVATVVERDYKRFKSFEYNKDTAIKEYLFCLQKSPG